MRKRSQQQTREKYLTCFWHFIFEREKTYCLSRAAACLHFSK